jgi:hypothetical protein
VANRLLNEWQCARILVAVLATDFGFDVNDYRTSAKTDYADRRMLINAFSGGVAFGVSLSYDELALPIDDVKKIIAQQLQPHVFTMWAAA